MKKTAADIYVYDVDPSADNAPANVLRFVGHDKRVLEIGAGPGSISKPLVVLNRATMTAVEIDTRSVEILKGFCDRVIQADLNDPSWSVPLQGDRFDAVVIGDVLEHLYDPWTTLQTASTLIHDDGYVVVSIPHAAHGSILASLLTGDLQYRDWGLLDRTHIRFFAIKNIQALFEQANLKIIDFAYVLIPPHTSELSPAWNQLPAKTRAILETNDYSDVYQVVVKAAKKTSMPGLAGYHLPSQPPRNTTKLKVIAFYLTQFHPIPENDAWWGKGFTEWTNTTKAQPLFPGHYQPHVPEAFGYYDLRATDVQRQQAEVAKAHGVDAFCFHYYWFNGKRLLERPLLNFVENKDIDIEFCLCWANENWTRKWDGAEQEILIEQVYSPDGDIAFIESIAPMLADPRYLKVEGRPVLIVYRPQQLPDPVATALRWRAYCREHGIGEIHLVAALTHENREFEAFGFDAGVEFPPHNLVRWSMRNYAGEGVFEQHAGGVVGYRDIALAYLDQDYADRRVYRTVFPSWDNSARVGARAFTVLDGTPDNYERWLAEAAWKTIVERRPSDRLLFVNAWNEWAEGCHLEPDQRYGERFLDATLRVKTGRSEIDPKFPETTLPEPPPIPPEPEPVIVTVKEPVIVTVKETQYVNFGLRTELGLWGVRTLGRFPLVYRLGRAVYRAVIRQE